MKFIYAIHIALIISSHLAMDSTPFIINENLILIFCWLKIPDTIGMAVCVNIRSPVCKQFPEGGNIPRHARLDPHIFKGAQKKSSSSSRRFDDVRKQKKKEKKEVGSSSSSRRQTMLAIQKQGNSWGATGFPYCSRLFLLFFLSIIHIYTQFFTFWHNSRKKMDGVRRKKRGKNIFLIGILR